MPYCLDLLPGWHDRGRRFVSLAAMAVDEPPAAIDSLGEC